MVQPNIVLPKMCPFDQTLLVFDEGGVITGLGEDCWYCPVCGYIDC
jgi:hypothetical protein